MRALLGDRRAQSISIAQFALALIAGAFLIWILQMAGTPLLDHAANATDASEANTATEWFRTFTTFTPAIFLLLGFFGPIVQAIFQREVR